MEENKNELKSDQQKMEENKNELRLDQQKMEENKNELKSDQQEMEENKNELKLDQQKMEENKNELRLDQQEMIRKTKINKIVNAKKMMKALLELDGNEAETRRRVEKIFSEVMNYDTLKNLSRERAIDGVGVTEHADFAIQLDNKKDSLPLVIVELKRVGLKLALKHLNQVVNYSINLGCEWVILTNGIEWQLHHVEFKKKPEVELIEKWNLIDMPAKELIEYFELINFNSIKRNKLEIIWEKNKVINGKYLLDGVFSEGSMRVLKKHLDKKSKVKFKFEEIKKALYKILNEKAINNLN